MTPTPAFREWGQGLWALLRRLEVAAPGQHQPVGLDVLAPSGIQLLHLIQQLVLAQLDLDQPHGQLRGENRRIRVAQQVGQPAGMILMAVGQDDLFYVREGHAEPCDLPCQYRHGLEGPGVDDSYRVPGEEVNVDRPGFLARQGEDNAMKGGKLAGAINPGGIHQVPRTLEVDALDGAPGVYSSRYARPDATDADNNVKLLKALADVPPAARTARFRSVIVLVDEDGSETVAAGACEGAIGFERVTFGYSRHAPVLRHLDLQIAAGEMIGMVVFTLGLVLWLLVLGLRQFSWLE